MPELRRGIGELMNSDREDARRIWKFGYLVSEFKGLKLKLDIYEGSLGLSDGTFFVSLEEAEGYLKGYRAGKKRKK